MYSLCPHTPQKEAQANSELPGAGSTPRPTRSRTATQGEDPVANPSTEPGSGQGIQGAQARQLGQGWPLGPGGWTVLASGSGRLGQCWPLGPGSWDRAGLWAHMALGPRSNSNKHYTLEPRPRECVCQQQLNRSFFEHLLCVPGWVTLGTWCARQPGSKSTNGQSSGQVWDREAREGFLEEGVSSTTPAREHSRCYKQLLKGRQVGDSGQQGPL